MGNKNKILQDDPHEKEILDWIESVSDTEGWEWDVASVDHDEALVKELRDDPVFASEYLKAAQDQGDPSALEIAMKLLAQAKKEQP